MGSKLCADHPTIKVEYFDRADELLGFPLSRLCFEGPEEELVRTENQQPAIFLVSVALGALLRDRGLQPMAVAGHSLGEYSALVSAGALDFEDGLRLTRRRGELMAAIAQRTGGIMAAILGLPADEVETACRGASAEGIVEVANYNSPAQTVISGEEAAVRHAMALARERGARKVVELAVSAPFHCSLMAPLAEEFGPLLAEVPVHAPTVPVVANVTADYERTPDEIRRNLVSQLASSVRWTESMERLIEDGIDTFVEVGPGKVLTGLVRQINKSVVAVPTDSPVGAQAVIDQLLSPPNTRS
jgi:[acyl-carrier-protein] S-malonyltransferase